jgi:hypothetical protein
MFALFAGLVALVADPEQHAAEIEALKRRLAAATAAERALTAARAKFDKFETATRDRHVREQDDLAKRRGTVYAANLALDVSAAEHAKLKKAWHNFGESDEVISGFRAPLRGALEKAARACGRPLPQPDVPNLPMPRFVNPLNPARAQQLSVRPRGTARRSRA